MSVKNANPEAGTSSVSGADGFNPSESGSQSIQTRLSNIVDSLDVHINPDRDSRNVSMQQELEQAEKDLHAIYARVTDLRKQLQLPPLTLMPDNEPPTYQSVVSGTQGSSHTTDDVPFQMDLEWIDVVERGSGNWSNVTLKLSRKVDEWGIIDFILFNGQKINKPAEGWGEHSGPHLIYGSKTATPIGIVLDEEWCTAQEHDASNELTSKGQREIHYSMTHDPNGFETTTISRAFAIQRRQN